MKVIWSDRALERVEEIALYIALDSLDAAARWTVALFDAVEHLGTFPESGKVGRDVELRVSVRWSGVRTGSSTRWARMSRY